MMTTLTLSVMINPRLRAIRQAKAKLLRGERAAQQATGVVAVIALIAVAAMVMWGPG